MNYEQEAYLYHKSQLMVNDMADQVRNIYNIEIPIANLEDVVSKIGGIVKYDARCCGYVEKNYKLFTIHVADNSDFRIKNFSIAQQLGKMFLFTDFVLDRKDTFGEDYIISDIRYLQKDPVNWTNEFAGALFMPKAQFIRVAKENVDSNNRVAHKVLAEHFNVTYSTASWRGKRLGIFED